jgi:membrane protein
MSASNVERGRLAQSPGDIPGRGWVDILWRVKDELVADNLSLIAAGAAFYGLLAIFPALAALVSLYGLFTEPETVARHLEAISGVVPEQGRAIIDEQLQHVTSAGDAALGVGAIVALLIAIWSAAKGMKSLMVALNVAYDETEKRGFLALNAIALILTFAILLVGVMALVAIAVVPALLDRLDLGEMVATAARWLRWPLLALVSVVAMGALYRYGASRKPPRWRWVLWGAVAGTVLWLIGSGLFSWYVSSFGSYNETYGSVAAVAVLMIWLWLSAFAVLLGAELNAEMEHQTRRDTTTGEPRPQGERDAFVADTVGRSRAER